MRINSKGVTLIELLVAMVVLTTGVLGFFFSFQFISRSLTVSRARTLATNLGQERVEALKNLSYYNLLITTAPAVDATTTPPVTYDTVNYPPETISIGGVKFTRYTFVALAQIDDNAVSTVTYTYPDTGMKQIVTHIVWTDQGVKRKWTLTNLLENPNINPLDASLSGTVTNAAGGAAIPGARVYIEQNPDWNDSTDSSGGYTFRVYHGSYTVRASSAGFYDSVSALAQATPGSNTTVDIAMNAIASGTIRGIAWYQPKQLLISQVVLASNTVCEDNNTHEVEYIELFNPTQNSVYLATTGQYYWERRFSIWYYDEGYVNVSYDYPIIGPQYFNFVFVSSMVPARSYYLISNCQGFWMNGVYVTADAYYGTLYENRLKRTRAGGVGLYDYNNSVWYDTVGWMRGGGTYPPLYWGTPIPDVGSAQTFGTPEGNQIVRVSSPGASVAAIDAYGRAYDTTDNADNFVYPTPSFNPIGILVNPRGTANGSVPVISGTPAVGASVSASDPYSGSTVTYTAQLSSGSLTLPYAPFGLLGVTTGTWTVEVAMTGGGINYYLQVSTVVVTQGQTTWIPNSVTDPPEEAVGVNPLSLTGTASTGFVKGTVSGIGGALLSGIQVTIGGTTKTTGANGTYFASASTGSVSVVANPNNANPAYVQQIAMPTVTLGATVTQNFTLSLGGSLSGYITSGTSPLPNITVTANIGGSQYGSGASNTSGVFTIRNLSTGTYDVSAVLDPGMDSTPNSISATVSSTGTLNIGTFTVVGAFGNIAGTVTDSATSEGITSGALILASTSAISSTPSLIAASSAPALTPVYAVSSKADGTYTLPVRGNSTYYLSVYIPVVADNGTVSVTTKTYSGILVYPSQSTGLNISIP